MGIYLNKVYYVPKTLIFSLFACIVHIVQYLYRLGVIKKSFGHRVIVIIVQDRPVKQLGHPAVLLRGVVRDDHITACQEGALTNIM